MAFNPVTLVRNFARNSPWVFMAIMVHVIGFAILAAVNLGHKGEVKDEAPTAVSLAKNKDLPPDEIVQPPEVVDRKAIPKNEEAEIVTFQEDVFIPTDEKVEDLHLDRGDPNSLDNVQNTGSTGGTAIGVGTKGHSGLRPSPFGGRRLGNMGKGRGGGSTQGTEKAVLDGLRWLVRHQNEDGSWSPTKLNERCACDNAAYNPKTPYTDRYDEGLTGMALLCFLGAGYSHESKQDIVDTVMGKRYKIGEVIKKGLQWLVKHQQPEGYFSKNDAYMYNEALAGMALTEAFGLTQNGYWKGPAQKAVTFLQGAQRMNPTGNGKWGWRYESLQYWLDKAKGGSMDEATKQKTFESDTSVTGWCVMALKSAVLSGLTVDPASMEGAMNYIKWATADSGQVGYLDPKGAGATVGGFNDTKFIYHPTTMSALGMCIRIFATHDPNDPFLDLASKRIVADVPKIDKEKSSIDYYYWYYGSLALNQYDGPDSPKKSGKYWGPWNKAMVDAVLALQDHTERACSNGGWMELDRWAYDGGPLYTTAINVLTLEVYYRYDNAFGGGKRN